MKTKFKAIVLCLIGLTLAGAAQASEMSDGEKFKEIKVKFDPSHPLETAGSVAQKIAFLAAHPKFAFGLAGVRFGKERLIEIFKNSKILSELTQRRIESMKKKNLCDSDADCKEYMLFTANPDAYLLNHGSYSAIFYETSDKLEESRAFKRPDQKVRKFINALPKQQMLELVEHEGAKTE